MNDDNYMPLIAFFIVAVLFFVFLLWWLYNKCTFNPPTNFRASKPVLDSNDKDKFNVTLSWDNSNAPFYSIYQGTSPSFKIDEGKIIVKNAPPYNSGVTVNNLDANKDIYFMILGTNNTDSCTSSSVYIKVTTPIPNDTKNTTRSIEPVINIKQKPNVKRQMLNALKEMKKPPIDKCRKIHKDILCSKNFNKNFNNNFNNNF